MVKHKIEDTFNFNSGDRFYLPPSLALELGKPWVNADDLNLLEKCRNAKPFQQNAYWMETLDARSILPLLRNPYSIAWNWDYAGVIPPF